MKVTTAQTQQRFADDRPTIMHVVHSLGLGGAEVLVNDMVAAMHRRFRFVIVALDEAGPLRRRLREYGAPVHCVSRQPGFDLSAAWRIARLVRRHRVDILHAHQYTPFVYVAAARLIGAREPRIAFTEHGRHYPDQRRLKRVVANRLLLGSQADRITAVCAAVADALSMHECIDRKRIEVIYNGVDPRSFHRAGDESRRMAMRLALGVRADQSLILHVGGFRAVKDHTTAVVAMKALRRTHPQAVLMFAGDGPMLGPIRNLVELANLGDAVRFLGPRRDVADLWQAADIGLNTSLSEGLSVAILEAMASGRPVIATAVGGNCELVLPEQTGLLAPRGDAAAIATAIARLTDDAPLRQRMGNAGRQRVEAEFTQRRMHAAFAEMYEQLAGVAHAAAAATAVTSQIQDNGRRRVA